MSLHKAAHAGLWKGDEMKWLLRGIFLIFLIFAGLITAGYFMPPIQSIERSIEIEAYPEDVFPFINDLQSYSQWSPLWPGRAAQALIRLGRKKSFKVKLANLYK